MEDMVTEGMAAAMVAADTEVAAADMAVAVAAVAAMEEGMDINKFLQS
jgi:hypothetical protein